MQSGYESKLAWLNENKKTAKAETIKDQMAALQKVYDKIIKKVGEQGQKMGNRVADLD